MFLAKGRSGQNIDQLRAVADEPLDLGYVDPIAHVALCSPRLPATKHGPGCRDERLSRPAFVRRSDGYSPDQGTRGDDKWDADATNQPSSNRRRIPNTTRSRKLSTTRRSSPTLT